MTFSRVLRRGWVWVAYVWLCIICATQADCSGFKTCSRILWYFSNQEMESNLVGPCGHRDEQNAMEVKPCVFQGWVRTERHAASASSSWSTHSGGLSHHVVSVATLQELCTGLDHIKKRRSRSPGRPTLRCLSLPRNTGLWMKKPVMWAGP